MNVNVASIFYYDFLKLLQNRSCSLLYLTFIKLLERFIKVFAAVLGHEVWQVSLNSCHSPLPAGVHTASTEYTETRPDSGTAGSVSIKLVIKTLLKTQLKGIVMIFPKN